MPDLNTLNLTGRLGRDPEMRTTSSEKSVTNFSLAVDTYGNADTLWVDVVAWGKLAENVAKYCSKGKRVAVAGRLQVRTFQRKDGSEGRAVECVANDVVFLSGSNESGGGSSGGSGATNANGTAKTEEEVPF